MHVIQARNVCEALPMGLRYLSEHGQREDSRAGPVLVAPGPVTTVYRRPTERVLFSAVRDANPFFHVAESMWLLAGRRDAAFLNNFVANFGARFAESASGRSNAEANGYIHGAYGHRWRHGFGFDQIEFVVEKLRKNPQDRQCVIQMWDSREGEIGAALDGTGEYGFGDLRGEYRDRPCNLIICLRVRNVLPSTTDDNSADNELRVVHGSDKVLDITVFCRSNDLVWGNAGANSVHFSVLLEYLAVRIGVGVGLYYQIASNYHCYESELRRLRERADKLHGEKSEGLSLDYLLDGDNRYQFGTATPAPLVDDPDIFDEEVRRVLFAYENDQIQIDTVLGLRNRFLSLTVLPMLRAHRAYKLKFGHEAILIARTIEAPDWRAACTEWLERRWRRT